MNRPPTLVGKLDTLAKLGTYLKAIQEADDRFTGRAIKNITDAVKVRSLDVELPDEWMQNPELFLFKAYDDKLAMLRDLTMPITIDMVIQEINRYAEFRIPLCRQVRRSRHREHGARLRPDGRSEEAVSGEAEVRMTWQPFLGAVLMSLVAWLISRSLYARRRPSLAAVFITLLFTSLS